MVLFNPVASMSKNTNVLTGSLSDLEAICISGLFGTSLWIGPTDISTSIEFTSCSSKVNDDISSSCAIAGIFLLVPALRTDNRGFLEEGLPFAHLNDIVIGSVEEEHNDLWIDFDILFCSSYLANLDLSNVLVLLVTGGILEVGK